ncbi:MAG: hypothetical protein J7M18_03735, partial [Candidatus Eremiobacteraeota bacterium]|nr:hypothetical protein [Candidatus Eremiobacteraeota bacterium]
FIVWLVLPVTAFLAMVLGEGVYPIYVNISSILMAVGNYIVIFIMKLLSVLSCRDIDSRFIMEISGPIFALAVPAILTFWYGLRAGRYSLAVIFLACLGIEMMIQGYIISGDSIPPFKMIKGGTYWDYSLNFIGLFLYREEIGTFIRELGASFLMIGTFSAIWEMGNELRGRSSRGFYPSLTVGIWAALFLSVIRWRPFQAGLLIGLWLIPRLVAFIPGRKLQKRTPASQENK